jgi:DNA primase
MSSIKKSRLGGVKTLKVSGILDEFEKDEVKKGVDIISLFSSFGVHLEKRGKSWMGRCPWHEDSTPSLSVDQEKGFYNCFGCGESGDAFDLVMKEKGLDFPSAVKFLKGADFSWLKSVPTPPKKEPPKSVKAENKENIPEPLNSAEIPLKGAKQDSSETVSEAVDLKAIASFYHKTLAKSQEARAYLESRGVTDKKLWSRFQIGYSDGSLLQVLSSSQQKELTERGLIRSSGKEFFHGCLVFPLLDARGKVVSFYGRSIQAGAKPAHLYPPGPRRGLVNREALKVYRDQIILTESVIDALSLVQIGVENVVPLFGTSGFTKEHLEALQAERVQSVVLALDNDEPGRKASEKIADQLIKEGFSTSIISPPKKKDWNEEVLVGFTREGFESLLAEAGTLEPEKPKDTPILEKKGSRYLFTFGSLVYRLLGVKENFVSSLRVNIQAKKEGSEDRYIDNVDLFSARSRTSFASNLAYSFDLEKARVEKDLLTILEALEEERDKAFNQTEEEEIILTDEEIQLGMDLLSSPDLFDRISQDTETLGYVGEDVNKRLLYIAASSRKLDDPISVIVLSESASGKSYLVDTIRKLIPAEDVLAMTSLSEQALNYLPEDGLMHKFLVMGEAVHGDIVEHQLREMLSAKELSRLVTTKDEKTGALTSRMVRKEVIVSAIMSSTNYDINAENASRSFVINTDESAEQTRSIHRVQRKKYSLERYRAKEDNIPRIIHQHHCAQRLLEKRVIVNPFADLLDFPSSMMRARRDHERFMDLIACVCFLRQFQKEDQEEGGLAYIACDLEDYRVAHDLMQAILPSTLTNFPKAAMGLYEQLREILHQKAKTDELEVEKVSVTQREIREATGLSQMFVKRNMKILCDYEYLIGSGSGARGSKRSYRLFKDEELALIDLSVIPSPEEMREKLENV